MSQIPWRTDLASLLGERPAFQVTFSIRQTAASLWSYGEDELASNAMAMSDDDLLSIQRIAAWYEDPGYPLPVEDVTIKHRHVIALASITYFEGKLRPLARNRQRRKKHMPEEYCESLQR